MSEVRRYHHIYERVEYTDEHGYRMEPVSLPNWMGIMMMENKQRKQLAIYSRVHVKKFYNVGPQYCITFTDEQIIRELSTEIRRRFL